MTNVCASNILICFPVCGKYESVCDCQAVLSYLEEGLEMEALKTNLVTVTLVSCTVEREDIHSSKHYITNNAAMHSYKAIMLRYFGVLVCCSWAILTIFLNQKVMATDQRTEAKYILGLVFHYIAFLDNIQRFFCVCASDWHSCQEKGPFFLTSNTVSFFYFGWKSCNNFSWLLKITI